MIKKKINREKKNLFFSENPTFSKKLNKMRLEKEIFLNIEK